MTTMMTKKSLDLARNPYPVRQSNSKLTIFAWLVTILISTLPEIVTIELFHTNTNWLPYFKIGLVLILTLIAILWKPLQPLRNFFVVMIIFFGLAELRTRIDFTWPWLQDLWGNSVFDVRMQAEQTGKLAVSCAMIAVLLVLGYKRRQIFLSRGDLRAPIDPVRILGFPKSEPWPKFGLQWAVYIAAALGVMQYLVLRPTGDMLVKVMPILPSILFYAALNAFNEEITYRAPMLSTLEPLAGSLHALWMSAYFFGIAHYFGTPGGIPGSIASIFMGWILSKAMVETRGIFWAWWIHFLSDVVILGFLAVSLL